MTSIRFSIDESTDAVRAVTQAWGRDDRAVRRAHAYGVWSCLVEPGDGDAGRLIAAFGPDAALEIVVRGRADGIACAASGLSAKQLADGIHRWRPRLVPGEIEAAFAAAVRGGVRLLTPDDAQWPAGVHDLGDHAPLCLWVRGDAAALGRPESSLAVVGARAASGYGEHVAMEIAAELAARGVTIVSGAAYGIDGAAHRAAMSADGITVALLAGGVDRGYPAGHLKMLDEIARTGAVASEVPCGAAPTKWRFLQRNRLIAAMAGATVVVEAGWRSGSLNTASHAAALGRPLGAVPGPVTSASSAGCHRLLREFDARCVTGPDDAAELLGLAQGREPGADPTPRTDDRTRIVDAMSSRAWREVDEIARRSGMSPDDVRIRLGMMQLAGEVVSDGTGWRRGTASG